MGKWKRRSMAMRALREVRPGQLPPNRPKPQTINLLRPRRNHEYAAVPRIRALGGALMLMPSRTRYRKQHRAKGGGVATRGETIAFGDYALQSLGHAWLESRQIEAARRVITRYIRRGGKVWIRVFPDKPVTKKPAETRMGKGKGAPDFWVAVVKPGRILYEMEGVGEEDAREALRLASHKLAISTQFVSRRGAA